MRYQKAIVEMTHKLWNLAIGFKGDGNFGGKYTVDVNGVEMRDLPKAPKTAAS